MAGPSELTTFKGEEDARKFFYLFENVLQKGKTDAEKAENLVMYLAGKAFDYYFENFTSENQPTELARNYPEVKRLMLEKFAPKKASAVLMKEAVNLKYTTGDIKSFVEDADRLYKEAKFNEEAKLGLFRDAIKGNPVLLQFAMLRGATSYEEVKQACLEFAENQKILELACITPEPPAALLK